MKDQTKDPDYLRICAEHEGGRARLCIEGYGDPATAAYFAREAAHYAGLVLGLESHPTITVDSPSNRA